MGNEKALKLFVLGLFCGADETRTRDLLRDSKTPSFILIQKSLFSLTPYQLHTEREGSKYEKVFNKKW
ncbi:MAG TPA: hypothetical protein DHV28_11265 [Ignavibacteriales bacterium]|nr:hypothetical protein [Ignavibacteriales bacterium]